MQGPISARDILFWLAHGTLFWLALFHVLFSSYLAADTLLTADPEVYPQPMNLSIGQGYEVEWGVAMESEMGR